MVLAAGRIVRGRGTARGPGIVRDRGSAFLVHPAATEEDALIAVAEVVRPNREEVANAVAHRLLVMIAEVEVAAVVPTGTVEATVAAAVAAKQVGTLVADVVTLAVWTVHRPWSVESLIGALHHVEIDNCSSSSISCLRRCSNSHRCSNNSSSSSQ